MCMKQVLYKVMIVDDEPVICQGMPKLVDWQKYGFFISDTCNNGLQALELATISGYDLIITDIRMPQMDGLDMIHQMQKKGLCDNFIVLSAYSDFSYAQSAIQFGVKDYLVKPINKGHLVASLERTRKLLDEQYQVIKVHQKNYSEVESLESALVSLTQIYKTQNLGDTIHWMENNLLGLFGEFAPTTPDAIHIIQRLIFCTVKNISEDDEGMLYHFAETRDFQSVLSYLKELLSTNLPDSTPLEINVATDASMKKIINYIKENYCENISLRQLSSIFYMNPAYLGRKFTKVMGQSFISYLNHYRVDRARELLNDPDIMIYEVCSMVGYKDLNYFYKTFKDIIGCTPSEYRHRAK